MIRNLRQLDDERVYQDAEELARLQPQVTDTSSARVRSAAQARRQAEARCSCREPTTCPSSSASWSSSTTVRSRRRRTPPRRRTSSAPEKSRRTSSTRSRSCDASRRHCRPRRPDAGRQCRRAGLLPVPAPLQRARALRPPRASTAPSTSAVCSTRSVRREYRRPGLVDRLSRRRHQLLDPAVGADQDPRQPGFRRRAQPPGGPRRFDELCSSARSSRSRMPAPPSFSDAEVAGLRAYLLKGGFLWSDDFWGTLAME